MKRVLFGALLAVLSILPLSAARVYHSVEPLVWSGGNHCTTFSINEKEGLWLTALHCVKAAEAEQQLMWIGDEPATMVLANDTFDAAVLKSAAKAKGLKLAGKAPKPNTPITLVGHPLGLEGLTLPAIVTRGIFLDLYKDKGDGNVWNLYAVVAAGGNSGSPVLSDGKVIGLLNYGWPGTGLCGGTPWGELVGLVEDGVWAK